MDLKNLLGNNENGFIYKSNNEESFEECEKFLNISKEDLSLKMLNAKKKSKLFTPFYNYKKLSYLLN